MAYCSVDELAQALRVPVTAQNTPALERALDAAAAEIDHSVDRDEGDSIPVDNPLAAEVNKARAVEWYKAQDAAFGVVGFADTGALQAPQGGFTRHAKALLPLKRHWGVA